MIVKLLTEHHLEFLSLKGGCRGSYESTHVKIPHCWKSHALAHLSLLYCLVYSLQLVITCDTVFLSLSTTVFRVRCGPGTGGGT